MFLALTTSDLAVKRNAPVLAGSGGRFGSCGGKRTDSGRIRGSFSQLWWETHRYWPDPGVVFAVAVGNAPVVSLMLFSRALV